VWNLFEERVFNLSMRTDDRPILENMTRVGQELGDFAEVRFGVKVYQKGKGKPPQTGEEAEGDRFRSSTKEGENYYPYLRGRDIDRWYIEDSHEWLKYGEHLAEPRSLELFTHPRIFLRRIVGERLVVSPTEETYIADQLVHTVVPNIETGDVYAYSGVLGSKLITYYFRKRFNRDEETFPEIRIGELNVLPVYRFDESTPSVSISVESLGTDIEDSVSEVISSLVQRAIDFTQRKDDLNLDILDYVKPDTVHIMLDGEIVMEGDHELAVELEDKGYDWIRDEVYEAA
jgi:hypothetical protein